MHICRRPSDFKNFDGHVTLTMPPFLEILRDSVRNVYRNIISSFNRFGAGISI